VTSAGFVLVESSDLLRNPDDPHTAKVFEMPGKSDKFLLKFRKPAHAGRHAHG
jgi:predicted methyltransferase